MNKTMKKVISTTKYLESGRKAITDSSSRFPISVWDLSWSYFIITFLPLTM